MRLKTGPAILEILAFGPAQTGGLWRSLNDYRAAYGMAPCTLRNVELHLSRLASDGAVVGQNVAIQVRRGRTTIWRLA